jgi:hypothetical protein
MLPFVLLAGGVAACLAVVWGVAGAVFWSWRYPSGEIDFTHEVWAYLGVGAAGAVSAAWLLWWSAESWECKATACKAELEDMMVQFGFAAVGASALYLGGIGALAAWRKTPAGLRPLLLVQAGVLALLVVVLLR